MNLIFKKLSELFASSTSELRGFADLLEDFIYFYDARGPKYLKSNYYIEAEKSLRDQAYSLLEYVKKENPFSSLPPKEANFLRTLFQAIESGNKELALNTVNQLSQEIEILDSSVRNGEKRTRVSYIISIVGVILTIVFGFTSLFSLFR